MIVIDDQKPSHYIVQTRVGREEEVKEKLIEKTDEFGIIKITSPSLDQKYYSKFFLGYLFVKMQLDYVRYSNILQIENVYKFLGKYHKHNGDIFYIPQSISEKAMQSIETFLFLKEKCKKLRFKIGDTVIIKEGHLSNIKGQIIDLNCTSAKIKPKELHKVINVSLTNLTFAI
jgi:transcription antitermination factor NusG